MATLGVRQLGRGLDLGLLTVTLILTIIGLGALFSTSLNVELGALSVFYKQLAWAAVGCVAIFALARLEYRFLGGIHWVLYGLSLLALLAVRFFGRTVNGTTGWFEVFGLQLQPVEFVKIIMCIVMAKYFSDHAEHLQTWRTMAISG